MPTVQQILNKVDKYRNSYSVSDKVDWMDAGQRQIFQDVPHEAPPYTFSTVADFWVCVTAGTPGTWKGFGMIEA